tara:strand:- start:23453 stop:23554 length:102 start_codon:yes stop_codon:yes gene_type:complete
MENSIYGAKEGNHPICEDQEKVEIDEEIFGYWI